MPFCWYCHEVAHIWIFLLSTVIPAAAAAYAKADEGIGVVESRVGLMAGGCGSGDWVLGEVAELGLEAPDLGLWNSPEASSVLYHEAILAMLEVSSWKSKNNEYI